MDFLEQIKDLASKGVTIDFSHDHYKNGINCNWSINFLRKHKFKKLGLKDWEKWIGTMWHGDNHEYGDPQESMQAAVRYAYFILENPIILEAMEMGRFPVIQEHSDAREKEKKFLRTLYTKEHREWIDKIDEKIDTEDL